jgi:hypothetical protein
MKNQIGIYAILLGMVLVSISTLSTGEEVKRKWMTSACYKFRLAAWDKFNGEPWSVRYVITSSQGRIFVAERDAASESSDAEVTFPDDFHDAKAPKVSASANCFEGEKYTWKIYVDTILRDSGTIGFTRD